LVWLSVQIPLVAMSQQLHQQSSFTRRRSSTLATPPLSPPPQARRRPSDTGGEVESPRLAFTPRLSNSPRISGRSDLDSAPLEDDEDWDEASLRREENEFERLLSTHIASVPGSFARKRVSDASPGGSAPGTPAPTALARPVSAAGQHALPPLSPAFSPVKRQSSAAELPLGSKDAAQTLPLGNIDLLKAFARFSSRGERESMPASNAVVSRAASITNRNRASSSATGRLKQYHTLPASAFLGKESMDAPASASAAPSAAHRKTNSLSHQRSLSMQRSSSALRSSNAPGLSRSLTLESITPAFLRFATLQGEVARTRADLKLAGQLGQLLLDQSYKMELQISAVEIRAEKAEEQLSAMQIRSDQAEMKAAECEVRAEQAEMKVSQLETELQQKQVQLDEAAVQAAQIAAAYQPTTPGSSSPLVSPTALSAAAAENESIHEYLRRQIIDTTRAMHEQAQIQQMKIASATSTGSAGESRPQPSPIGLVDFARPFSADQLRQKLKALNPTNLLRAYQQLHNAQQRQAALKLNGLEKQVAGQCLTQCSAICARALLLF
jgi:hypothetical protein